MALTQRNSAQFDRFAAPFAFQFQLAPDFELEPRLGFSLPVETVGGANLPRLGTLGLGARYSFTNLLDAGVSFEFVSPLVKGQSATLDERDLQLFLAARF